MSKKYFITEKELKPLKKLQEELEDELVTKQSAAVALKYAIEDIEALEVSDASAE